MVDAVYAQARCATHSEGSRAFLRVPVELHRGLSKGMTWPTFAGLERVEAYPDQQVDSELNAGVESGG